MNRTSILERRPSFHQRFAAFLSVEPGEERLIGLLILLYFILAFGFVFVQSMAFGIFLTEYGVEGLPYSYIVVAIVASLVAAFYIKLGGRISFSKLLYTNLIFLGCVSLLIWLALQSPLYHYASFILPLWFQIVVNLGNLAVWPLAGSLFDFRQGKRLFPLLAAGNWLANVIGGFFISPLVNAIGATNLLLLAGISFGAGLVVLRLLTHSYLKVPAEKPRAAQASRTSKGILKDRYVVLIFAYTILWWVAFFFVDNIFYNRSYAQYPDADQLAAFIGRLISMMGILALIFSTMLTGRLISRFGLRVGLLTMPVVVIVCISMLALSSSLGAPLFIAFVLGSVAKLTNVALGFSLSQSANAIVYQSLPDPMRGRVQAAAEGVVQPVAIGIAGLSLLALTSRLNFTYVGLAYVFIGLGAAWLAVIFLLSGNYVQALTRVITRRRLGEDANVVADPASLAILRGRLKDAHPGVVIYALTRLEALDEEVVIRELPNLLQHPAPEVRREAFVRIEKLKLRALLNPVKERLSVETSPPVKESALRALGAISDDHTQLTRALNEEDACVLSGALVGLLKYGDDPAARQRLQELAASASSQDRVLAIQVLGEVNRREFYPPLIAACDIPETSRAAGHALAAIGAQALPEIETAFKTSDAPQVRLVALAKALGRIGGTHAQEILLSRLSTPDDDLRSQVINALSQTAYQTRDAALIQEAVRVEMEAAAWVSAAQVDLGEGRDTALLFAALQGYLAQIRSRALLLLSFTFGGDAIRRVREALLAGSPAQASYALEIMDTRLPIEWKGWVMPLLEDLSPQARSQRFSAFFPQVRQPPPERFCAMVENDHFPFWVRACAAYTWIRLDPHATIGDKAMLSIVEKVLILKTVPVFSQTPDNVLADVADLLEEVDVAENETIFNQGDAGDSLYVILDGKVRVHDGERLLNDLGERDVFGEMALLDPEPRLASVTAVEPTRLFRLDQASFYDLMSERPEVATGIIRVLTSRLRNRVRDIAQLNTRIKELESVSSI